MPDFGKSCCGCCEPDCQEHVNLRAEERFYTQLTGMDGRSTFIKMSNNAKQNYEFATALGELISKHFPDRKEDRLNYPLVVTGAVDKYQITKYEEVWQKIEKGEELKYGYDPFDY